MSPIITEDVVLSPMETHECPYSKSMATLSLRLRNFLSNEKIIICKLRFVLGAIHTKKEKNTTVNVALWVVAGELVPALPYQTVLELMNLVVAIGTSSLE